MPLFHRIKKKTYSAHTNEETAIKRLKALLGKFDDIPKVLQRYLTKKIFPDFQRLTHFMKGHFIERKSNKLENYYRQTDPNQIKKIYKTITRIFGYLNQKNEKMDTKTREKFQHPIT